MHPSPRAVVLRLDVADRVEHLPGQHYVIRLTAEDGYTAQRSYSIASAPADPLVELFVERLDDGEVSGFLADVVQAGDQLEVRGPIGGWFVWRGASPAVGVGGGSGVVPLVAMLRHAARPRPPGPAAARGVRPDPGRPALRRRADGGRGAPRAHPRGRAERSRRRAGSAAGGSAAADRRRLDLLRVRVGRVRRERPAGRWSIRVWTPPRSGSSASAPPADPFWAA